MDVCVCVCACASARECACVLARVCLSVRERVRLRFYSDDTDRNINRTSRLKPFSRSTIAAVRPVISNLSVIKYDDTVSGG